TGRLEWKDFANECKMELSTRGDMVTHQRTHGATVFDWEIPADNSTNGAATVTYASTTAVGQIDITVGGGSLPERVLPITLPAVLSHSINQRCEATKLTVEGIYGLHTSTAHTRAPPSPAAR